MHIRYSAVLGLLLSATSLFAQSERKPEFALGYSNLQGQGLPGGDDFTGLVQSGFFGSRATLHGFDTSFTVFPAERFGLTGDFSFNANSVSTPFATANAGLETNIFYFMGGPTFTWNTATRMEPFVRVLAGGAYSRFNVTAQTPIVSGTLFKSGTTDFAMAVGGGLDVRLNDGMKLRAFQVDYAPIFLRDASLLTRVLAGAFQPMTLVGRRMDNVRFTVGIVF